MTKKHALQVIGSSASDCEIEMMLCATNNPATTLETVADTLQYMNEQGIGKVSHRKALMKAGRQALNVLGCA